MANILDLKPQEEDINDGLIEDIKVSNEDNNINPNKIKNQKELDILNY